MGKRANGASRGLNTISGKMKRTAMVAKRHEALANSQRRDFEQTDAIEAPEFRLFNSESDGPIVSWFSVREADYEVERRVVNSRKPMVRRPAGATMDDFNFYREVISIPVRPAWSPHMSRKRLVRNEEKYFEDYLANIYSRYAPTRLNHFEHNLQVWRQLWRVCESSDVLLVSADARFPMFHLPPSLYQYITDIMKRPLIMILNKIDLISAERQSSWIAYMLARYPKMKIVPVSSFPHSPDEPNAPSIASGASGLLKKHQSHEKRIHRPVGIDELMLILEQMYSERRGHVSTAPANMNGAADAVGASSSSSSSLPSSSAPLPSPTASPYESHSIESSANATSISATAASKPDALSMDSESRHKSEAGAQGQHSDSSQSESTHSDHASDDESSESDAEDQLLRLSLNQHNSHPLRAIASQRHAARILDSFAPAATAHSPTPNIGTNTASCTASSVSASSATASKKVKSWWEYEQQEAGDSGDEECAVVSVGGTHGAGYIGSATQYTGGDTIDGGGIDNHNDTDSIAGDDEVVENSKNRLIIGVLGHPNAGKSSLINAIVGRACVGVSATPGKTKHLQTIILNERFMLCDCPGLVFPAVDMPKPLQVLSGIFPLPQTREPYSIVGYLAERVPVERIYALKPIGLGQAAVISKSLNAASAAASGSTKPKVSKTNRGSDERMRLEDALESELELERERAERLEASAASGVSALFSIPPSAVQTSGPSVGVAVSVDTFNWSAWDVCESFAHHKGFKLQGGGYDTYKAAHAILEDALAGVIDFSFPPPPLE